MRRGGLAALLALACATSHAAADRCVAAEALVASLAARGLFQGAFVMDVGAAQPCEGAHGYADVERSERFTTRTPSDGGSIASASRCRCGRSTSPPPVRPAPAPWG